MPRALSIIIVAVAVPDVAAAAPPRYDVEGYCTQIASIGGDYSGVMYDSCFDMEQSSYNNLKQRWDGLPSSMRSYCDEIATIGGDGSYMMLESCVQMEEQAGSTQNTFEY